MAEKILKAHPPKKYAQMFAAKVEYSVFSVAARDQRALFNEMYQTVFFWSNLDALYFTRGTDSMSRVPT